MSELGEYPSDRYTAFVERVSGLKIDASESDICLISDKNSKIKQQKKRKLSFDQIMEELT